MSDKFYNAFDRFNVAFDGLVDATKDLRKIVESEGASVVCQVPSAPDPAAGEQSVGQQEAGEQIPEPRQGDDNAVVTPPRYEDKEPAVPAPPAPEVPVPTPQPEPAPVEPEQPTPAPEPQPVPTPTPTPTPVPASNLGPTYFETYGKRFESTFGFRTLQWAGRKWAVRSGSGMPQAVDPASGQRNWIAGAALLPNGDLELQSAGIKGGVEIIDTVSTGYGKYTVEYSAHWDAFHESNVFGIFPYDWVEHNPGGGRTEIDLIEVSRWHDRHKPFNEASSTVYPDEIEGVAEPGTGYGVDEFPIPGGLVRLVTVAEWRAGYFKVTTSVKNGPVVMSYTADGPVPRDNAQQMHINLWTSTPKDPVRFPGYRTAKGETVVLHDYRYEPIGTYQESNETLPAVPAPIQPTPQPGGRHPLWRPAPALPGCDEDEPDNWDVVIGEPYNPTGPTYTRWHGKRLYEDWGQRTFDWCGWKWAVHGPFGPPQAPHPLTRKQHWVNGAKVLPNGDLEFSNQGINGGAEIMLVPSTGYGTYEFEYSADFGAMHPSNVLGIFTYSWNEFNCGGGYGEIDFIEISRWNAPHLRTNHASSTYYPDDLKKHAQPGDGIEIASGAEVPNGRQRLLTRAEWRKNYLKVTTSVVGGPVLYTYETRERVPRDNDQQIHINLWVVEETKPIGYQGWRTAHGDTITFHRFDYNPGV